MKFSLNAGTNFMKVMAPEEGVQVLGWSQYGHVLKMYLILESIILYFHTYMKTTERIVRLLMEL